MRMTYRCCLLGLLLLAGCSGRVPPPERPEPPPQLPTYEPKPSAEAPAVVPDPVAVHAPTAPDNPAEGFGPASGGPPPRCGAATASLLSGRRLKAANAGTFECKTAITQRGGSTFKRTFAVTVGSSAPSGTGDRLQYDAEGNLIFYQSGDSSVSFGYEAGRLIWHKSQSPGVAAKTVVEYDNRGYWLRSVTKDDQGRVSMITIDYGDSCYPKIVYYSSSHLKLFYSEGSARPDRIEHWGSSQSRPMRSYAVHYNGDGRIESMEDATHGTDAFAYDASGRLNGSKGFRDCKATYDDRDSLVEATCSDANFSFDTRTEGFCPLELCEAPPVGAPPVFRPCLNSGNSFELRGWPGVWY